jgi:hypothetical protein
LIWYKILYNVLCPVKYRSQHHIFTQAMDIRILYIKLFRQQSSTEYATVPRNWEPLTYNKYG